MALGWVFLGYRHWMNWIGPGKGRLVMDNNANDITSRILE